MLNGWKGGNGFVCPERNSVRAEVRGSKTIRESVMRCYIHTQQVDGTCATSLSVSVRGEVSLSFQQVVPFGALERELRLLSVAMLVTNLLYGS